MLVKVFHDMCQRSSSPLLVCFNFKFHILHHEECENKN